MMSREEARLRPRERLKGPLQYQHVFRQGVRLDGRLFTLLAIPNALGYDRLGVTAGRQIGGATERNRAKRLLRETFRLNKRPASSEGFDVVLVAKKELVEAGLIQAASEFRERLRRVEKRIGQRARGSTRPH